MSFKQDSRRQVPMKKSNRSLVSLAEPRLSIIAEDGDVVIPTVPRPAARSLPQRFVRRWNVDDPPRHSAEKSPPPYSFRNTASSRTEKLVDVKRRNGCLPQRGGWKRLIAIALVFITVVVALAVGLVIGLRKHNQNIPSKAAASPTTSSANETFPLGSYTITTFLDEVLTNCTSNPSTWNCYPYQTFQSSPTGAMATFNWIISESSPGSAALNNFIISSSDNDFAPRFSNASLGIVNSNTPKEFYTFSIPLPRTVVPTSPITDDNSQASCYYGNTQITASLYTRLQSQYPQNMTSTSTESSSALSSSAYKPWPFAVTIMQTSDGGVNIPECYKGLDGTSGTPITNGLTAMSSTDTCECLYKNYDP